MSGLSKVITRTRHISGYRRILSCWPDGENDLILIIEEATKAREDHQYYRARIFITRNELAKIAQEYVAKKGKR